MHEPTTRRPLTRADAKHAAVILPDGPQQPTTSYARFAEQIESLEATLRQSGLQPGDAVGIVLPNGLENLVVFLAVTRARLVAAPLNPAYKTDEFKFYLEDIGVKALIGPNETHTVHAPAHARHPDLERQP